MLGNWDLQRKEYGDMRGEGSSADSCIRCGACEEKCPQHIAICDQLTDVAELLG
jgi:predicted aldo/keto reductase-like oxidoreductase